MGRGIIKLAKDGQEWYLEWSTIVDAPITYGMNLEEFKEYIKDEYGKQGLDYLPERIKRADKTGTSYMDYNTLEHLIEHNRAGPKEICLTYDELIQQYCIDRK